MKLGPYELKEATKVGLMLAYRGDSSYVKILRDTFPAPVRWFGPYESFDPHYQSVLYVQEVNEESLRAFLEFLSSTVLVPTALDECWALSIHMSEGGRSPEGDLVFRAKTYRGKHGEVEAAEQLATLLASRCRSHPAICSADVIVGVPAYPPKEPYNLPDFLAERLGDALGVAYLPACVRKVRTTPEIKNLPNEQKLDALEGAYEIQEVVRERSVVIVDDLVRSGTTLGVIGELMRRHGAARLIGMAATKTVRGEL